MKVNFNGCSIYYMVPASLVAIQLLFALSPGITTKIIYGYFKKTSNFKRMCFFNLNFIQKFPL